MPTLKEIAVGYVKLRDQKKVIAARHKDELAPLNDSMKKMEAFILDGFGREGLQNIGIEDGPTVYKSNRSSVKIVDWGIFLAWMLEHEAWDFLAKRAAPDPVKEYLEEEGHLPPGITISTEQTLGVRK